MQTPSWCRLLAQTPYSRPYFSAQRSQIVSGHSDLANASFTGLTFSPAQPLFDVKFYPWPTEQDEQVFAVCGEKDVSVKGN